GYEHSVVVDRCRHIVLGSSTLDHNPDYGGGRIDGVVVRGSSGISMANLIVEGARAGGPESGAAVEVVDSSEVSVDGCQVLDPEHRGIEFVGVRNGRVSHSTVLDRRPQPSMREAIRIRGNSRS